MSRSPRTSVSLDASGSFIEERSKTFVVPRRPDSADGASACDTVSNTDMDTLMALVNTKFDKKERQIKRDMRDEFERRLERDKRHHEEIIATLRRDLSNLTKISHEYDGLKDLQKSMQREIMNQHEKLMALREENTALKVEAAKIHELSKENEVLRLENESLKREHVNMEMKAVKLKSTIHEKEQEILSLKTLIDTQYKRIKLDLTNTRDKFHNEQETLHAGMKQHHVMLAEISAAVKQISNDMEDSSGNKKDTVKPIAAKSMVGRNRSFPGKTKSEPSFGKLTGTTPKKRP
ncbi:hypothetical protein ACF0H5_014064 [Mactra antiquata]